MEFRIEYSSSDRAKDKQKIKEVLNAICAILNSCRSGGKLILFSMSAYTKKNSDDITRKIEQKLEETFGLEVMREIIEKIPYEGNLLEIHYRIKPTQLWPSQLYTVDYNLYCTSSTQVHRVPSSTPAVHVVEIIKGEQKREKRTVLGTHLKVFSHGEAVPLEEGKDVQFKCLEDKASENSSLAKRMTNPRNKLLLYVSAFANGSGGHIYYGIKFNDSGEYVAWGQNVDDKIKITNEVKNAIDKLFVWPDNKVGLKKEKQWDIFFEKVSNTQEARYIIVISVNSHDRGVSTGPPESYVFDKHGEVQQMEFREWTEKYLLTDYWHVFSNEELPQLVGRSSWSSPEALGNHCVMLGKLVKLRNDGRESDFNAYKSELLQCPDASTKCLIQQQEAASFLRKGCFRKAEAILNENETLFKETAKFADDGIYRIRWLYWKGVVTRAQGDYKACDELCVVALQNSQQLPIIFVIPWIYHNRAKTLEIAIAKELDGAVERDLRNKCMEHYQSALRCTFTLQDFPENLLVDLKQRILISMARLSLGVFYHGGKIVRKMCLQTDVDHAKKCLDVVDASVEEKGCPTTRLSKAEYRLAHAEQYYNRWRMESSKQTFIHKALEESKKALKSSTIREFKAVKDFAKEQIKYFQTLIDYEGQAE